MGSRAPLGIFVPGHGHRWNAAVVSISMVWRVPGMCSAFLFCPVSGFPPAGLSLAVLRSWFVFNVFSVRQCCDEPGRVFVWIVAAMTVSCSTRLFKYL